MLGFKGQRLVTEANLVDGTLMSLAGKRFKIAGLRSIAQLLDVGVVNLETKLAKFPLDVLENSLLELIALSKDLFHSHGTYTW